MQYHLAQIKAFCDAHPIDAKVLIVPTMTTGHDLTLALAATGYSWLNLQIETPRSLAEKDGSAHLIAEGYIAHGARRGLILAGRNDPPGRARSQ